MVLVIHANKLSVTFTRKFQTMDHLKYPTGQFSYQAGYSDAERQRKKEIIRSYPERLANALENITDAQLDTHYRSEGWTLRQVIHHVADSHMNAYIRFKWALSEDQPVIKAYNEKEWAKLPDTQHTPISVSIDILRAVHQRWLILMDHMRDEDWQRAVFHPESKRVIKLEEFLGLYAWHGDHHLGHIKLVTEA